MALLYIYHVISTTFPLPFSAHRLLFDAMSGKSKAVDRSHRAISPGSDYSDHHHGSARETTDDLLVDMEEEATPKKGRKKKDAIPSPSMHLDWQEWIKEGGTDVPRSISDIRVDDNKALGQIRRLDPKDVEKKVKGFLQRPPSAPIHLTVWEDAGMSSPCLFRMSIPPHERLSLCCTALCSALRRIPQTYICTAFPASTPCLL